MNQRQLTYRSSDGRRPTTTTEPHHYYLVVLQNIPAAQNCVLALKHGAMKISKLESRLLQAKASGSR